VSAGKVKASVSPISARRVIHLQFNVQPRITPIHGIKCNGSKVFVEQIFLSADWRNFPVPLGRQECRPNPQTGKSALLIPISLCANLAIQRWMRLRLFSRKITPPVSESKNAPGSGAGTMEPGTTNKSADEKL
jgi:hypothetical protein